jgi:hypothetical protein
MERNKLLRFDSFGGTGGEWSGAVVSTCQPKPPGTSPADDVVGVEATVGDGAGGLGNGALERRRELLEKAPGLSRPDVA